MNLSVSECFITSHFKTAICHPEEPRRGDEGSQAVLSEILRFAQNDANGGFEMTCS